jgi:tetratricopeptide (TPR) repeat protein
MTMAAALALAVPAGLSAPAFAQALSPDVGNPLKEASGLAKSGTLSAAMARVKTARASADTSIERRKVAEMAAFVYTRGGQWSAAARELESIGAPASQLAPLYYRAGDYGKAAALGRKVGGVQGQTIVAQSYFRQGNFKGAAGIYQALIKQYGPRESWLQNLANVQYKLDDKKGYLATTTRLIKVDPSPARWRALLVDLKNESMPSEAKLALFELMSQTNNVTKPEDYQEFAKLAIIENQPGVAKRALEQGRRPGSCRPRTP